MAKNQWFSEHSFDMFRSFETYGCIPALGILVLKKTALKPGDGLYGAVDNSSIDRVPNGNPWYID